MGALDANMMTPLHYAKKEDFVEGVNLMSLYSSLYYDCKQETEDCYNLVLGKLPVVPTIQVSSKFVTIGLGK